MWSPDGSRIAFLRRPADPGGYHGEQRDLMVVGADGSGLVQLTRDTTAKSSPAWSPDGARIAYTARHILRAHVDVVDVGGAGTARELGRGAEPTWSPDGRRLAYVGGDADGPSLIVVAADGSSSRVLVHVPPTRDLADPTWSPDGRWIAYAGGGRNITVMQLLLVSPDALPHRPRGSLPGDGRSQRARPAHPARRPPRVDLLPAVGADPYPSVTTGPPTASYCRAKTASAPPIEQPRREEAIT